MTTRVCSRCKSELPTSAFNRNGPRLASACRNCENKGRRARYLRDPLPAMVSNAKTRAGRLGIPFDISPADLEIPERCPVLGIPIAVSPGRKGPSPGSPTLDRIDPTKGYVRGNVAVISHRANTIKQDARPDELLQVALWVLLQLGTP